MFTAINCRAHCHSLPCSLPCLLPFTAVLTAVLTAIHCHAHYHSLPCSRAGVWEVIEITERVLTMGISFDLEKLNMPGNSSLILAADRTHRKNPLDDLNYYNGGWNITNEDYYASVLYTAAPLFLVAGIWFILFGLCLLLTCIWFCCCGRKKYGYSPTAYGLSLFALLFFTVASLVGSAVLYTGQGKFHETTTNTVTYVVSQSHNTTGNLRNVSDYLAAAKNISVDQIALPQDLQNQIDQVDSSISSAANTLESETAKNKHRINDILHVVSLILIILAAVMLALALLGFLFSILGLRSLVYLLVFMGWILVTVTFILAGVFLALFNVTGDTCVAMDEWVQHPEAHTALDDILPCVDRVTAEQTLNQTKAVTFKLSEVVNGVISNISNNDNIPKNLGPPLSYNQSGPLVPLLCNPFNDDMIDRNCSSGEVHFTNATEIWKNYVCRVSESNVCTTIGRLTPTMYNQMSSAVNVSYGLNHYGPFLTDLMDCTFVRDTFRGIHDDHCSDLKEYSKWIYIGLIMVSAAVAFSLIFWVLYARERRHRKYTKMVDERMVL